MKKILTLKVTEICSISKSFLPNFDCPVKTLLLIVAEDDKGETVHVIIPTDEAMFQTDNIRVGERSRFVCYTYNFFISKYFEGYGFTGFLCLKVMDV